MKYLKLIIIIIISMMLLNCSDEKKIAKDNLQIKINKKKKQIEVLKREINDLKKDIYKNMSNKKIIDNRVLVNVMKLKRRKFVHYITQNGSVEAVKSAFISPEINGQIKKIYVKEGQYVHKGKLLIKLNSNIIEKSIKEVETALNLSVTIFEKRKKLWDKNIGSEIDYLKDKTNMESLKNKLDTLKAQLEMSFIKAPFSGIIETVYLKEGELAAPGKQIIQLIDLSKLYINVDISEKYVASVRNGDWAEISFPSYEDLKIVDKVYFTGNSINIKNRTFRVKILIDNNNGKLKPNSISTVKLIDYKSDNAIIIPSIIVKRDIKGDYVYVVKNKDSGIIAEKRFIEIGLSNSSHTMILKGLNIGEKVIIGGYNMVKNGSEIKIKNINGNFEKKNAQVLIN